MIGVGEEPTTPCEHKADSLNSLPISFHQASPKKMWVMTRHLCRFNARCFGALE
jgi:hypothetical protein